MSHLFSSADKKQVVEAITQAELHTSGEIRVHVESHCPSSSLDRAVFIFRKLKMDRTAQRNGVLLYVALESKKLAVIGDAGINAVVPPHFWDQVVEKMQNAFAQGLFVEGLCVGIQEIGSKLQAFFPYDASDVDELPNDISFGA